LHRTEVVSSSGSGFDRTAASVFPWCAFLLQCTAPAVQFSQVVDMTPSSSSVSPPVSMVLDETQRRIIEARHHDPFGYLGCHPRGDLKVVHVHLPGARSVHIVTSNGAQEPLERLGRSDLFSWQGSADTLPKHYLLRWVDRWGVEHEAHDPYSFGPQLLEFDLALFA